MLDLNFSLLFARDQPECTLETCPVHQSSFGYYPSLGANLFFLVIFFLSFAANAVQGVLYGKRTISFAILLCINNALEVVGYAARANAHDNPFLKNPFLIQIICLTIAPLFICAGIYLCLGIIVRVCGQRISYLKPRTYARIFIPFDVFSLCVQAAGGGIADAAGVANKDPSTGNHILLAGVAIQVCTLFIFMGLSLDIMRRYWVESHREAAGESILDPAYADVRARPRFRLFLVALGVATVCVFIRCVYRVVEMADGWTGKIIKTQGLFIGFEGTMITLAVVALNVFHPGYSLWMEKGSWRPKGRRAKADGAGEEMENVGSAA